jgi:Flp pilus assembly pilin Flp
MRRKNSRGQAILEYILLVLMIAVTVAVIIRNTNRTIYCFWTGMARQVAKGCADCTSPAGPGAELCTDLDNPATQH